MSLPLLYTVVIITAILRETREKMSDRLQRGTVDNKAPLHLTVVYIYIADGWV